MLNKIPACSDGTVKMLQILTFIIFRRKKIKTIGFEQLIQMRLPVENVDLFLTKTMAFFVVDIAGIPAVRTIIGEREIVGRIAGRFEEFSLPPGNFAKLLPEGEGWLFAGKLFFQGRIGKIRDTALQFLILRNLRIDSLSAQGQLVTVRAPGLAVFQH